MLGTKKVRAERYALLYSVFREGLLEEVKLGQP